MTNRLRHALAVVVTLLALVSSVSAATTTTWMEPGTDATQDFSLFGVYGGGKCLPGGGNASQVSSATDYAHTGPRSLKWTSVNLTGGATACFGPPGIMSDTGSQVSLWFRFDSIPSSEIFLRIESASQAFVWGLSLGTNGTLSQCGGCGATGVTGTAVLAVNTWYHISVSYYATSTTVFQFKVYVNDVLDSTMNTGTLTRTGGNTISLYWGTCGAACTDQMWMDDIYTATGGASSSAQPDPGDIRITAKRPVANGTTNGYTTQIGSSGSGYGTGHSPQVNEQPLSTTNGWSMIGAGSAVTEEYNVEGPTVGDVDLRGVAIIDYMAWLHSNSAAGETAQIVVNGAASNITLQTTACTNAVQCSYFAAAGSTTYPPGTGADVGEITSTGLTTVNLYECGILIAFRPTGNFFLVMQ